MENQPAANPEENMSSEQAQEAQTVSNCPHCSHKLGEDQAKFCPKCGFPVLGTEKEKDNFLRLLKANQEVLADAKKKINRVKIMLYIIGGLQVFLGLMLFMAEMVEDSAIVGISSIIVGLIMFACSVWVKRKPVTGILVAFSFYMLLHIANAIIEPSSIASGLILKIIVIAVFISGIKSAYDYREYEKKLNPDAQ